jgi:ABC-type multidrug transport system ATPase subunit
MYFGIPEGECFGYLGLNGAGKTTTMTPGEIWPGV